MKTRQSKRLHNQNVGTTKPVHLHNNEETTMSKYLYYTGYVILAALTLFFCWMFCLRWGVFGAKVDWISQHSVIPDYFRKQFYATGKLLPAFIVSVAESKRIWQSCQLRCGCYFFADGTYDLPVLQPDYVR